MKCLNICDLKINHLYLRSKALKAQEDFYTKKLGFELLESSASHFTIQLEATYLTFEQSEDFQYYHFAFNIPSFQVKEAFAWLDSKATTFIKYKEAYIVDFQSWNAEAIYFYDMDGNIGELIARKNLAIVSDASFSVKSILNVSEIGLSVLDVGATFQQLTEAVHLPQYSGDQHYFCAMGDEEGLFIIVDQKTKLWMPTQLPAVAAPFKLNMTNAGNDYKIEYTGTSLFTEGENTR